MKKLFLALFLRNIRSITTLFLVILCASTGFIVIQELAKNIENSVASETKPLFWADLKISYEWAAPEPLIRTFGAYLTTSHTWAEIREFSTSLTDSNGKTGLVNVIAYTGEYPQRWILETNKIIDAPLGRVSASDELWERYVVNGKILLDNREIQITDRIVQSSDIGFSFGDANALLIVPLSLLENSSLISFGSRLDQELLISFTNERDADIIAETIRSAWISPEYRVRTFSERSESNLDIVTQLSDYILMILLVSCVFAAVIMRSAHDALFSDLSRTLRTLETLWFTRRRQRLLFAIFYSCIIPLAFCVSVAVSYGIISLISLFPGAEGFVFLWSSLWSAGSILLLLILASFFPAWVSHLPMIFWQKWSRQNQEKTLTLLVIMLCFYGAVYTIFDRWLWSLILALSCIAGGAILFALFHGVYRSIFALVTSLRRKYFGIYDAMRSHIRPLSPTIPITLSLVLVTTFFIIFFLFSLSFREKLIIDDERSANIYAINILPEDYPAVSDFIGEDGEIFSVLRARIMRINNRSLAEHLDTENPSREFTREFNITTSPLTNPIIRGNSRITAEEVSVDDEFADRIGIGIGDTVEFLLSGKTITLRVANIRASERQWFRPFFYFSFSESGFENAPKTYFATTYTDDIELWKRSILERSGPHVTFVDIASIITIVRDIGAQVLSVISLFFLVVSVFSLFAIIALLGRMRPIEALKYRLYPLFWYSLRRVRNTLTIGRASIFVIAGTCSLFLGIVSYYFIVQGSTFLSFSLSSLGWMILSVLVVYMILIIALRPKR